MSESQGMIQSPGWLVGEYPNNVTCEWVIMRPAGETRGMALRVSSFGVKENSLDYLKVIYKKKKKFVIPSHCIIFRIYTGRRPNLAKYQISPMHAFRR